MWLITLGPEWGRPSRQGGQELDCRGLVSESWPWIGCEGPSLFSTECGPTTTTLSEKNRGDNHPFSIFTGCFRGDDGTVGNTFARLSF